MRIHIFDRKILTLLGIVLIIGAIFVTTFLAGKESLFRILAGPNQDPQNLEITNISDASFTVSYTTEDKVIGTVQYGQDPANLENLVLDDRDQLSQSVSEYYVHSITLKDLAPESIYYFNIISGGETYLNNGSPFNAKTGALIEKDPLNVEPLSGKVILPDGSNVIDALVYFSLNDAQQLSAVIKDDGNYTIPLNTLRNDSLNDFVEIDKNEIINIEVTSGNLFSSVSVSADETNPVPVITLSNTYDFSLNKTPTPKQKSNQGGFPNTDSQNKSNKITIASSGVETQTTPTPSETLTPIPSSIPTLEPTLTATPLSTQTPISSETPVPTIPPTGNSSVIIALIAGFFALGAGLLLYLLTRGQISL